jgi:hypothetical protein
VTPDWKPASWWELKASYSYLEVNMENRQGSNDPTSVAGYEGSSPRHQGTIQSLLNLPKKFELDQTYRYVSALSAFKVKSYGTADARLGWHFARQMELSVVGQNLLQPHHSEFGGDAGGLVGIKRSVYVQLTWKKPSETHDATRPYRGLPVRFTPSQDLQMQGPLRSVWDWGTLALEDVAENEYSIVHGFQLLSSYETDACEKLWIITEVDRSTTNSAVAGRVLTSCGKRIIVTRLPCTRL